MIDLTNPAATSPLAILPLGSVDRSLAGNEFDPSDQDGIDIGDLETSVSLLQPDAIATFTVGGETYFVTANEGDARVGTGLTGEEVRLSSGGYNLDDTVFPNEATLKQNANLGRLNVINHEGDTDGDGDIDVITTYRRPRHLDLQAERRRLDRQGARDRRRVRADSVAAAEREFVLQRRERVRRRFDSRSDNKGPEPEGVDIGGDQRPHLCVRDAGARRRRHDLRRHRSGQRELRRLQAAAAADGAAVSATTRRRRSNSSARPTARPARPLVVTANEVGNATTGLCGR